MLVLTIDRTIIFKHGSKWYAMCHRCGSYSEKRDRSVADRSRTKCRSCPRPSREYRAEYTAWKHMKDRCDNPSNSHYHRYGGRGIKVCSQWYDFDNFISDVGTRPTEKHSLDRIDNNSGYCPGNVRWATHHEQANNKELNRRYVFRDLEPMTASELSRLDVCPVSPSQISNRIRLGWSIEDAVTTPLLPQGKAHTQA